MKEKYRVIILHFIFITTVVAACLIAVYGVNHFTARPGFDSRNGLQALTIGWQYETPSGRQPIPAIPATLHLDGATEEDKLTLVYRLPETLPDVPTLEFITQQSSVEVILDGKTIYQYGLVCNAPVGHLLGNARNQVFLPYDSEGKEVTIRLHSPYTHGEYHIPAITLGSRATIMYRFAKGSLGISLFSQISAFFCILALVAAAFFKVKHIQFPAASLIYFTLFLLISTVWVLTDSNVLQLLTPDFQSVYFVSHLAFMLIPLPLMLFLRRNTCYGRIGYGLLLVMFSLGIFVRTGLFFAGIADLESSLLVTHAMMAIASVVCITLLAREWHLYRQKSILAFLIGFIGLACCLLVSLLLFIFSDALYYSVFFIIALMLMMGAMFYELLHHFTSIAKTNIENQLYQKMAYTDGLTGIPNRLAFEEELRSLESDSGVLFLTMLIFDINHLKFTNDTYGHSAGDNLIKAAALTIRDCFQDVGTFYRLGGDEFAVLLRDYSEQSLKRKLEDFEAAVAKADTGTPEGLQIAAGYAVGDAKKPYQLFDTADKAMYRNKFAQRKCE